MSKIPFGYLDVVINVIGKKIMANSLYQKHIISIPELSREELELIVETAGSLKKAPRPELIKNKVVASCFFEPSTRTRLSFETAIQRIGGDVIGFDNDGNTSGEKRRNTRRFSTSHLFLRQCLCDASSTRRRRSLGI